MFAIHVIYDYFRVPKYIDRADVHENTEKKQPMQGHGLCFVICSIAAIPIQIILEIVWYTNVYPTSAYSIFFRTVKMGPWDEELLRVRGSQLLFFLLGVVMEYGEIKGNNLVYNTPKTFLAILQDSFVSPLPYELANN